MLELPRLCPMLPSSGAGVGGRAARGMVVSSPPLFLPQPEHRRAARPILAGQASSVHIYRGEGGVICVAHSRYLASSRVYICSQYTEGFVCTVHFYVSI
jgi:hypothetical protein